MNRTILFDKPVVSVDIDKLPIGAIFFVEDEPYMRIAEIIHSGGIRVNCIHLRTGDLELWETKDSEYFNIEFFPDCQNIKIVGD